MLAHLGVLALALLAGYGLAAVVAIIGDRSALAGLPALWRLGWSRSCWASHFLARAMRCHRCRAALGCGGAGDCAVGGDGGAV